MASVRCSSGQSSDGWRSDTLNVISAVYGGLWTVHRTGITIQSSIHPLINLLQEVNPSRIESMDEEKHRQNDDSCEGEWQAEDELDTQQSESKHEKGYD